jgi:hypothetical protein
VVGGRRQRLAALRRLNLGRKAGDALVEAVDLCQQLGEDEALMRLQMTPQRLLELWTLLAQRPSGQRRERRGIIVAGEQRRQDGASSRRP